MKLFQSSIRALALSCLFLCFLNGAGATAAERGNQLLDCPLRDAPFSVDSPLVDLLLSPAASAALEATIPGLTAKMPARMVRTEAPTFAAIVSVRTLAGMAGLSADTLDALDAQLAGLEVTDTDRVARCQRYDNDIPEFEPMQAPEKILVFHKINGYDHGPSVDAATSAIKALAEQLGLAVAVTDRGGAFNDATLAMFDAVVWNNVSGDVLTLSQRAAFEKYIHGGGGFLGIHGSGGDSVHFWDWYADTLLGARFIGHPFDPQFQDARVQIESHPDGIGAGLSPGWSMLEEWYSFSESPRDSGAKVVATLDEGSYDPVGPGGQDLRMGADHPIVWTRCVGKGRSLFTAIGHRPEVYHIPENLLLLRDALSWAAKKSAANCDAQSMAE